MGNEAPLVRSVVFEGDSLLIVPHDDSWAAILPTWCDVLGIDVDGQIQRLDRLVASGENWACTCKKQVQLPGDSQRREVTVLPRRALWMWLAGVKVGMVKASARPKLLQYKERCVDALDSYWSGLSLNGAANPVGLLEKAMESRLAPIEATVASIDKRLQDEARAHGERLRALESNPLKQLHLLPVGVGKPTFDELCTRAVTLAGDPKRTFTSREHLAMLLRVPLAIGRVVVAELLSTGALTKRDGRIVAVTAPAESA